MAGAARSCLAENAHYAAAWACIESRIEAKQILVSDPRFADLPREGKRLATAVEAGTLQDAEARKTLMDTLPLD